MDIQNMSDRQLGDLINRCEVELMERRNAEYEMEISHGILVQDCSLDQREDYLEWLRGAGNHHYRSQEILEAWDDYLSQEDIKQSRRTTGA